MLNDTEKNNKDLNQNKYKQEKNIKGFEEKLKIVTKSANFQIAQNPEKNSENKNQINDNILRINQENIEGENKLISIQNIENKEEKIYKDGNNREINKLKNEIINIYKRDNNRNINQINSNKRKNNDNEIWINKNTEIFKVDNAEENNNENQLSHNVIIEYEDGIDQNVEINYKDDEMSNEYNYEKETKMINQGINTYNNCKINNMKIQKYID